MTLSTRTAFASELRRVLERRERESTTTVPKVTKGRNADGTLLLERVDGECIERGGVDSSHVGSVISRPTNPYLSGTGLGAFAGGEIGGATVFIDSHEPKELTRGQTVDVTVTGGGFDPSLTVSHRVGDLSEEAPEDSANPDLEVLATQIISDSEATLTVMVSAGAQLATGSLAYGKTEALPERLLDAYKIVPNNGRYVGWMLSAGSLVAVSYDAQGQPGNVLYNRGGSGFRPELCLPAYGHGGEALLWRPVSGDRLNVVEISGGQSRSIDPASGFKIAGFVAVGDLIHWIEWQDHEAPTTEIRLMQAPFADFDQRSLSQNYSLAALTGGSGIPVRWNNVLMGAYTAGSVGVEIEYHDPFGSAGVVIHLATGAPATFSSGQNVNAAGIDAAGHAVTGPLRWNGFAEGEEGFAGFSQWFPFSWPVPPVGVGAPGPSGFLTTHYEPATGRLWEANPAAPPSVAPDPIQLTPHPEHGLPGVVFLANS